MLSLYLVTAIVGGVFVLLSAFGGSHDGDGDLDHDHDFDHDLDCDHDIDFDADLDADLDGDLEGESEGMLPTEGASIWLPFLSMRFWTYFLTFFGVTGLLLTGVTDIGSVGSGVASGFTGLTAGLGMAYGTRYLRQSEASSGVGVHDLVGLMGVVKTTIQPGSIGKIVVHVRGQDLDFIARVDEEDETEALIPGTDVLLIGFDEANAKVVRASYLEPRQAAEARVEVKRAVARHRAKKH